MDLLTHYRMRKVAAAFSKDKLESLKSLGKKYGKKYGPTVGAGVGGLGLGIGAASLAGRKGIKDVPSMAADAAMDQYNSIDPAMLRTAGYTGAGALGGALVGGLASKENKLRNALLGAAIGGLGGYAADYGRRRYID